MDSLKNKALYTSVAGTILKFIRESLGLTYTLMAKKINISRRSYTLVESGDVILKSNHIFNSDLNYSVFVYLYSFLVESSPYLEIVSKKNVINLDAIYNQEYIKKIILGKLTNKFKIKNNYLYNKYGEKVLSDNKNLHIFEDIENIVN